MKVYRLMHQEKIVAVITFNGDTPVNLSVINAAYMPIGTVFQYKNVYKCTITKFKHWWGNRIIPNSRSGIQ
jgi:hypothetical protein